MPIDSKTPEKNLHRYMQRIDRIIGNRSKSPLSYSMIRSRNKSPSTSTIRTNKLDKYLTQQMVCKNIVSAMQRHNRIAQIEFLNKLRNGNYSDNCERPFSSRLQRNNHHKLNVDRNIAVKFLSKTVNSIVIKYLYPALQRIRLAQLLDQNRDKKSKYTYSKIYREFSPTLNKKTPSPLKNVIMETPVTLKRFSEDSINKASIMYFRSIYFQIAKKTKKKAFDQISFQSNQNAQSEKNDKLRNENKQLRRQIIELKNQSIEMKREIDKTQNDNFHQKREKSNCIKVVACRLIFNSLISLTANSISHSFHSTEKFASRKKYQLLASKLLKQFVIRKNQKQKVLIFNSLFKTSKSSVHEFKKPNITNLLQELSKKLEQNMRIKRSLLEIYSFSFQKIDYWSLINLTIEKSFQSLILSRKRSAFRILCALKYQENQMQIQHQRKFYKFSLSKLSKIEIKMTILKIQAFSQIKMYPVLENQMRASRKSQIFTFDCASSLKSEVKEFLSHRNKAKQNSIHSWNKVKALLAENGQKSTVSALSETTEKNEPNYYF